MQRNLALRGVTRQTERPVRSIACLAFVAVVGAAFWAGVMVIAQNVMQLAGAGF